MPIRTIYLSCAPTDWEATRGLRDAFDAASLAVTGRRPNEIATAWRFVACFSLGNDGAVRYDRQELLTAIGQSRLIASQRWLVALKLQQCHLPVLPITWSDVPTIEPTTDWTAVVEQIVQSQAQATATMTAESLAVGRDLDVAAAELSHATDVVPDAHLDLAFQDVTVDRDAIFTAGRVGRNRQKGR